MVDGTSVADGLGGGGNTILAADDEVLLDALAAGLLAKRGTSTADERPVVAPGLEESALL